MNRCQSDGSIGSFLSLHHYYIDILTKKKKEIKKKKQNFLLVYNNANFLLQKFVYHFVTVVGLEPTKADNLVKLLIFM